MEQRLLSVQDATDLEELNKLIKSEWRVVSITPISVSSGRDALAYRRGSALVLIEKTKKQTE